MLSKYHMQHSNKRIILVFLALSLLGGQVFSGASKHGSLCLPGESVIYSCLVKRKIVSICANADIGLDSYIEYRYGKFGHPEMIYRSMGDSDRHVFYGAENGAHFPDYVIWFVSGEYEYILDITSVGNRRSTLFVTKNAKKLTEVSCTGNETDYPPTNSRLIKKMDPTESWGKVSPFLNPHAK